MSQMSVFTVNLHNVGDLGIGNVEGQKTDRGIHPHPDASS